MRSLHLEKKDLRDLAIAESFRQNTPKSILSGVVMRRDFLIDGFVFGSATLEGDDATQTILKMYDDLNLPDISYVLISGLIISMYNIIDIHLLSEKFQIPVIGVSYADSEGLESAIKHHFPNDYESKISEYKKLGNREKITLHNSSEVYVRKEGCTISEVKHLLDDLTIHGAIPEPIRVPQLLAKTLLQKELSF